ncbi:MAG: Hsp33 family molecular chaperone HslO [Alphaproteobacteria bacterium]|nr:Hsp33 family molecular chaperone HslO [Alphaproteobacteria bacterium]
MSSPTTLSGSGIAFEVPAEDVLLRFQVEGADVHGRFIRLGPLAEEIIGAHDYPAPVARLLGEALVLAAMMGAALKTDGSLIFQANGDGTVPLLLVNYRPGGLLRAYAQVDADAGLPSGEASVPALLGRGHLAITLDPGPHMDRYQGLVALEGETLTDCALAYFQQSEQIATSIVTAVGTRTVCAGDAGMAESWQAGGIMIQHLAALGGHDSDAGERAERIAARGPAFTSSGEDVEEAWERATVLLSTVEASELLDPEIPPWQVLRRIFAEDGARIYEPVPLRRDCRCTRERIRDMLASYGAGELSDMIETDGAIRVTCAFCNETFAIRPDEIGD